MQAKAMMAGVVLLAAMTEAGMAQTVGGKAARDMVFAPGKAEVELLPQSFLPADQAEMLRMVGSQQAYYGAIAVSPDEGIMVEATVAAANYHTTEAASAAALAGCEAKRKGAAPCAVVALIRPAGWQPQPLTLSAAATEALRKDYGRRGARAMAVSASTGVWGLGKGAGAVETALRACSAMGQGVQDCTVTVAD